MGRLSDVQTAFDTKLNSLSSAGFSTSNIAWPNYKYKPEVGTAFIRPTLLPGESIHMTLDGSQRDVGIYQIDVFVEPEKGYTALMTLLDDIYDHFDSVDLTKNSTQIFLGAITRTPIKREESWMMASIEIQYHSYST